MGDFVFKDSGSERTIKLDDYQDFFDCATEIEEHKKRSEDTKVLCGRGWSNATRQTPH